MGSFEFNLRNEVKTLNVILEGMFTPQNGIDFIAEYKKNTNGIKAQEYVMTFDATKLKVSAQEMIPILENCMQMYKETGFNKIVVNIGGSAIVKSQVSRVANKVGLLNCEII